MKRSEEGDLLIDASGLWHLRSYFMSDASALNVSGDLLEAGPSYSYSFSLSSPSICSSSSQLTISPAVSKFLESTRLQTIFELRC